MRNLAVLLSCLLVASAAAAPARRPGRAKPVAKPARKPAPQPAAKKPAAAPAKPVVAARMPQNPAPQKPSPPPGIDLPGSIVPGVRRPMPKPTAKTAQSVPTVFQTNREYDPRIDLKTDFVAIHAHGAPWDAIDRALLSWKAAGYPVHRMFFIGSDAGRRYTSGEADGTPHPGDVETDASGKPITIGDRPYMVPTEGWLAYLKEHIRRAIDAGAEGIWPEEPLLHGEGGYSPAFKAAWQQFYEAPWREPHESPATYFRASRLKADLYLRAVNELLQYTKTYAREKGRDVKFYLPVHSPIGYAASGLIFPHAAASRLPVDGLVAQVWSGPARQPVPYGGKSEPRLFENSWLMYSYFANLMEGMPEKSLYLLADPVEDDPGRTWAEYERWYKSVLAASLLFPQARGFEVMPWPERIFLSGQRTASGAPAPPGYLTQLANLATATREIAAANAVDWSSPSTRGIGVLTLDTMMWQRGGPQGSSMRSFYGLVSPLLQRGVPVEVVPAERVSDRGFLGRFKVLLLSYDMQKPLGPEVNQGLAAWIRSGGVLVLMGGADAYTDIGEWWSRSGFAGPTDHLLRECNAGVEPILRSVHSGAERFQTVLQADAPVRDLSNRKVHRIPLAPFQADGKPVYVRFTDRYPNDGWGTWLGRVRVLEGDQVRADFRAGSVAERPFLVEDTGSVAADEHRFADRDASFTYRFNQLGPQAVLELELGNQYHVGLSASDQATVALTPVGDALPPQQVTPNYSIVSYPLTGAEPLQRSGSEESAPAWVSAVGNGSLIYCGLPAAYGADSTAGAELVRSLVQYACRKAQLEYQEGPVVARRGPYVIAHALGRSMQLKGQYIDLFQPQLPLVTNPQLPYREPALLKEVKLQSRIPALLHASHRARVLEQSAGRLTVALDGPEGTQGVLRVFPAGMSIAGIDATDFTANKVKVEARIEGRTLRITYPQRAAGLTLTIRWIRPEARLTK